MAQIRRSGKVTVIETDAEYDALDQPGIDAAHNLLLNEAQSADPPLVVIDLSRTAYMGSAFIEVIFRCWKRMRDRGGQLALCGLQPFCAEVLRATRLDTYWKTFPTADEAVAALTAES